MRRKKIIFALLMALLTSIAVSGCGDKNIAGNISTEIEYAPDGNIYPMKTNYTLSVWTTMEESSPIAKAWQEQTGVKIDFLQGAVGYSEALNLLIASGSLPDILMADFFSAPGGIQKYADDNVIVDLTALLDEFAPNYKNYLSENKELDRMVKSDDGKYYMFPFVRGDDMLTISSGPVVRKDLLDKGGLEVPKTIEQWNEVLTYFKKQGASAPLSYDLLAWEKTGGFMGAFGAVIDFYVKDGEIKYGYMEPELKEGIELLAKWYSEGLLDEGIVQVSNLESNILNSKTCASYMYAGSGIGKYNSAAKETNDSFELVAVPYPVLNSGSKPNFTTQEFVFNPVNNAYITTACENIELATRLLDFGYSEKGHMLFNFGIEGESYNMVDGYPAYTDAILNSQEGLSISAAMSQYILGHQSGPFVQDRRYIEQYYSQPQQKDALTTWITDSTTENKVPPISFTVEESQKLSQIMNNVETCANENLFKFIMGITPLDQYDAFKTQLEGFGIQEAIDIYQAAYERYLNRM